MTTVLVYPDSFDPAVVEPISVQRDGAEDPVEVKYDTHIMDNVTLAKMNRLPPAFEPGGIITAGNASAVVDGGAATLLSPDGGRIAAGIDGHVLVWRTSDGEPIVDLEVERNDVFAIAFVAGGAQIATVRSVRKSGSKKPRPTM